MSWLQLTPLPPASAPPLDHLPTEIHATTLSYLLSNDLIMRHTLPYLPASAIFRLAATSRTFWDLIYNTPGALRHLDLTWIKSPQVDSFPEGGYLYASAVDRTLTEEQYYSTPLRNIFGRLNSRGLLQSVQTLVLDCLSVGAELIAEVINDPSLNVRILSIRRSNHIDERKLQNVFQTACRPDRPPGTPRLEACYIFTAPLGPAIETPAAASYDAIHHGDVTDDREAWYRRRGIMLNRDASLLWAKTIQACRGVIAFDAMLCGGPRHVMSAIRVARGEFPPGTRPDVPAVAVATHALDPCHGCGSAPEGLIEWGRTDLADCPLLDPMPLHSSSLKSAKRPSIEENASFVPRCAACLCGRHCSNCMKWWCENCYSGAGGAQPKGGVTRECWECGENCYECISKSQRICRTCSGGYCLQHNDGSSPVEPPVLLSSVIGAAQEAASDPEMSNNLEALRQIVMSLEAESPTGLLKDIFRDDFLRNFHL